MKRRRILLGGVPFGRNNIGDEAILAATAALVKQAGGDVDISVMTGQPEQTAQKLGIGTYPLIGFDGKLGLRDRASLRGILKNHDYFIWAGATGLSDYPHVPLNILSHAQSLGLKTAVFCVGMNNVLNPNFFKCSKGKKYQLYRFLEKMTGQKVDLIQKEEAKREVAIRNLISSRLSASHLVVLRDRGSQKEVLKSHIQKPTYVGSDPAVLITPTQLEALPLNGLTKDQLVNTSKPKIGICVSAQQPIEDLQTFASSVDSLISSYDADIYFIPMNPLTDSQLMRNIREQLQHKEKAHVIDAVYEPEDVAGLVSHMDVVISSRLHLLILASITHVPIVGISRGSKIANYLSAYGLNPSGDVNQIEEEKIVKEAGRLLENKDAFIRRSHAVRNVMVHRLYSAKEKLRALFA